MNLSCFIPSAQRTIIWRGFGERKDCFACTCFHLPFTFFLVSSKHGDWVLRRESFHSWSQSIIESMNIPCCLFWCENVTAREDLFYFLQNVCTHTCVWKEAAQYVINVIILHMKRAKGTFAFEFRYKTRRYIFSITLIY